MELRLSNGGVALIDDEAFEQPLKIEVAVGVWHTFRICDCTWRRKDKERISYVQTVQSRDGILRCIRLHRLLMEACKGVVVDHIDRNPLNNLRENLRTCDVTTNNRNREFRKKPRDGRYVNPVTGEEFVRTFEGGKEVCRLVS